MCKDIENNLSSKRRNSSDESDDSLTIDSSEIALLNEIIPPYVKGNARIMCHNAIELINRFV